MKANLRAVGIILIGLVAAFFASNYSPQASTITNQTTVKFFDVGQGDAELIITPHRKYILIDGGPDSTILTRLGEALPFNAHQIDLMIASHDHADHITGLNAILNRYNVNEAWVSGATYNSDEYKVFSNNLRKAKTVDDVWAGKTEILDGVSLQVLHPLQTAVGTEPANPHDANLVVRACYLQICFMMMGDMDEAHEQMMLDAGENVSAQVLKVAHHGSNTGTLPAFLTAVNPNDAVISLSADNTYGFPSKKVMDLLESRNVNIFRTDQNSTVTATTDGHSLTIKSQKKSSITLSSRLKDGILISMITLQRGTQDEQAQVCRESTGQGNQ